MPPPAPPPSRDAPLQATMRSRWPLIAYLLGLSLACALVGCGNSHPSSSSSSSAAATNTSASSTKTSTTESTTSSRTAKVPASPEVNPQETTEHERQRTKLVAFVSCMRHHGYHLREPDAHNHLSTRGFNMQSPRLKAVGTSCFEKTVVKKAQAGGSPSTTP